LRCSDVSFRCVKLFCCFVGCYGVWFRCFVALGCSGVGLVRCFVGLSCCGVWFRCVGLFWGWFGTVFRRVRLFCCFDGLSCVVTVFGSVVMLR